MSFLSMVFAACVAITVIAFHVAPARLRPHVLLLASLGFYATHGLGYLALLVALTFCTWRAALMIESAATEQGKKRLLTAGVVALVLILCGFKLAGALTKTPSAVQMMEQDAVWRFALPLGLSYYSFRLISYLLEVYWERLPAQRSLVAVSLYVSFFPQIVSGPIQRPGMFFEQLSRIGRIDTEDFAAGLRLILFGFFKKIAIADRLEPAVAALHAAPGSYSSVELLFGAYAFAIQLYADFSGLTDIALGIGRLFGIKGPENFDLPFLARNLQEYWRRWHMSLTSWLADYLFTPLRMTLRDHGQAGLVAAIFLNMVAVGIWHDFKGTYLAFGVFHGVALSVSVLTLKRRDAFFKARPGLARVRKVVGPLVTFHLVVLGLVLFRAQSLPQAAEYLTSMVSGSIHGDVSPLRFALDDMPRKLLMALGGLVLFMEAVHVARRSPALRERFMVSPRTMRWAGYYGLILLTLAFSRFGEEHFIYGQF